MKVMKVAIDSGPLTSGHAIRGVGAYTRELVRALDGETKKLKNIKVDPIDFSTSHKSLITNHYDIVHHTFFNPFFLTLPIRRTAEQKIVVTIHDLIPLIYPKYYPPGIKGTLRFWIQKYLIKNVNAVISDSETSKKDIVRFLGVDPKKVHVVYLAAGDNFKKISDNVKLDSVREKYRLPRKFVMYLGDINYNKNLPTLISACRIADVPLVVCGRQAKDFEEYELRSLNGLRDYIRFILGKPHPELAHYQELQKLFKDERRILRLGYVPDEDLVSLFNLATVYVQPSLYEGFGLPVLQAFSCGVPVVVSKTNCLVEIAGGAAPVADTNNPKDMASKILSLFPDTALKVGLVREGLKRAKSFSWQKTARQTVEVYKSVISE